MRNKTCRFEEMACVARAARGGGGSDDVGGVGGVDGRRRPTAFRGGEAIGAIGANGGAIGARRTIIADLTDKVVLYWPNRGIGGRYLSESM
ncbi:MAG: hypothetical protein BWY85_00582 [Firmicutes bacterium ADurb.Bin506]|jgi:hypothetical protein|nr:MAG: hypothetical protein BWY85_00582 [Firmicutes bacterium ADurb.Bin506]